MLLYYSFWMFMGFTIHFYIIFGTSLLTGGPAQIVVFCLFLCFAEKEYQTESKRNETFGSDLFGTNTIQETWSGRQEAAEVATRVGSAPPASWLPWPTSFAYIYLRTPKTSRSTTKNYFHHRNLLYPWDPILEPWSMLRRRGNRPWRASTSSPRPLRWVLSSLP